VFTAQGKATALHGNAPVRTTWVQRVMGARHGKTHGLCARQPDISYHQFMPFLVFKVKIMTRSIRSYWLLPLVAFILLRAPVDADAHGTDYSLVKATELSAVAFYYSDGEAMAYAEVLVFSPKDPKVEHQNGRTDKHGKFAFCPDTPGTWRITANDSMGHLCQATVEVSPEPLGGKSDTPHGETEIAHPVQGSKTLRIIAGLSLILNLAFAACFLLERSHAAKKRS